MRMTMIGPARHFEQIANLNWANWNDWDQLLMFLPALAILHTTHKGI